MDELPECTCDLGGPRHNGDCPAHPDSPERNRPVDRPAVLGMFPLDIACPVCTAKRHEACRSTDASMREPHWERRVAAGRHEADVNASIRSDERMGRHTP